MSLRVASAARAEMKEPVKVSTFSLLLLQGNEPLFAHEAQNFPSHLEHYGSENSRISLPAPQRAK